MVEQYILAGDTHVLLLAVEKSSSLEARDKALAALKAMNNPPTRELVNLLERFNNQFLIGGLQMTNVYTRLKAGVMDAIAFQLGISAPQIKTTKEFDPVVIGFIEEARLKMADDPEAARSPLNQKEQKGFKGDESMPTNRIDNSQKAAPEKISLSSRMWLQFALIAIGASGLLWMLLKKFQRR